MRVTIRDIAASLHLSTATVSLALNDSPLVKLETTRRVKAEAARLGYTPNQYARSLARGRSGRIALAVPDIQNVYYASLVHYVNLAADAAGYQLSIFLTNESLSWERAVMRSIVQNNMEAVLLAPVNRPDLDAEYVAELNGLDIPLVFATARHPGVNAPGVASNLQEGMRLLTSHAVATGGKRVAFLTGSRGVETIDIREESYREVLAQAGLTPEIHRVSEITLENAYRFVLGAKDLPDTLLCLNDMMAVGALNALMERGISVPEQIRVAGFDDGWYARVAVTPLPASLRILKPSPTPPSPPPWPEFTARPRNSATPLSPANCASVNPLNVFDVLKIAPETIGALPFARFLNRLKYEILEGNSCCRSPNGPWTTAE